LYLTNNVVIGGGFGPALPAGWSLESTTVLTAAIRVRVINVVNGQAAIDIYQPPIGYRRGDGPSLLSGWELVAAADFNSNGHPACASPARVKP
jgi:hypothetical protein